MSELTAFIVGVIVGVALSIHLTRRYRNRDGKLADIIRRVSGATKES